MIDPLWLVLREFGRRLAPRDPIAYALFRDEVLPVGWANLVNRTRMQHLEALAKKVASLDEAEDLDAALEDAVHDAKGLVA
jgi:hypothetical protein